MCKKNLLFSSLSLLLLTFSPNANAEINKILPSVNLSQNLLSQNNLENNVYGFLQGIWQGQDPLSGEQIIMIFNRDNKFLVVRFPVGSTSPSFMEESEYRINANIQPMQLDILNQGQLNLTIFEFTADGKLRLEVNNVMPGKFRPTTFSNNTAILQKLPKDSPQAAEIQSKIQIRFLERDASNKIRALTRAQQAFRLERPRFATAFSELNTNIGNETANYRFEILPQGNVSQIIVMTATAKQPGLRSYTGVVFVTRENYTFAGVCESDRPATSPPKLPKIVSDGTNKVICVGDSHSL